MTAQLKKNDPYVKLEEALKSSVKKNSCYNKNG